MTTSTEIVPTAPQAVAVLSSAALERMSKAKFADSFGADELMVPWLQIVQTSSGYMKRNSPLYIPEAREGDITDSLTRHLRAYQGVILLKFEKHYTTWKPNQGPLVKQWFTDPSAYNAATVYRNEKYKLGDKIDEDGNWVVETPLYYVLMVDLKTGLSQPATMAWGSTQAKKTRRVNTLAREDMIDGKGIPFTPPIYARLFDITTAIETGGENGDKSWGGWVANVGPAVLSNEKFGEMWYAKAEAFREQIEKGNVRPAAPNEASTEGAQPDDRGDNAPRAETYADGQRQGGAVLDDKEIPF